MLNHKKNLYIAGAFALCALTACSSDSPSSAGSTTMPNAAARSIEFKTAATSVEPLQGGELKAFEEENGASAGCSAGGIFYSSEIQIDSSKMVVTHLKLENAGNLCSGIFTRFSASCGSVPSWWEGCDENGNVDVFCGDFRMTSLTACTTNNPPSCSMSEPDTTVTFNEVVSDFSNTAADICNKILSAAPPDTLEGIAVPMDK